MGQHTGQAAGSGPAQVRNDDGSTGEKLRPDGGHAERSQSPAQTGRRIEYSGVRLLAQQTAQNGKENDFTAYILFRSNNNPILATSSNPIGEDGNQG